MQNREELRQTGMISQKTICHQEGENLIYGRGGGNIISDQI
jgi:hypothetical protein